MVMFYGVVVEEGPTEEVIHRPRHPYTYLLLQAIPVPDPSLAGRASDADAAEASRASRRRGLRLRQPVPVRGREMPDRAATARAEQRGSPGRVPLPRAGAAARALRATTRRTWPARPESRADAPGDGQAAVRRRRGAVDLGVMARLTELDPATLMADNLAIVASAVLIAVTATFGRYVRRADRQSTDSRPRGNRPRSRTRHPRKGSNERTTNTRRRWRLTGTR